MDNKRRAIIIALALTIMIGLPVGIAIYDMVGPAYTFRYNVRGHMENAYYADYPELMKDELEQVMTGIDDLNLQSHMYGAFFPWNKTPDRRMDYQFKHLNGIMSRIDAVIAWREANYGPGATGGTEALGDVYEQKMDNLREFLKEDGWSDWIAEDAFYVNNYLWVYLSWIYTVPVVIISMIVITYEAVKVFEY